LPKGKKLVHKRAYISLKYPFLAIHAKGGESISPKQKDTPPSCVKKSFSIWYLIISKKGEKVAPSKIGILKPS
jgi:hypothetical protein